MDTSTNKTPTIKTSTIKTSTIKVDGMMCEHCVKAIKNAVGALDGVNDVVVDLAAKTVTVSHDSVRASVEAIKNEIEEQGYDVM